MSGDCFEVAMKLLWTSPTYRLIHAIVERRSDGKKHIHSFILDTESNMIIEKSNNNNIKLPKEIYFALGNIEHYVIYDINDVCKKCVKYKHYGPWDSKLIKLLATY
jgi:mevalonate pyrophosphate decarboxylase